MPKVHPLSAFDTTDVDMLAARPIAGRQSQPDDASGLPLVGLDQRAGSLVPDRHVHAAARSPRGELDQQQLAALQLIDLCGRPDPPQHSTQAHGQPFPGPA